jgi:hypothetical protein
MSDQVVSARIVEDTVQLLKTSTGLSFRVTALISNKSDRRLEKGGRCEPDAQVLTNTLWHSLVSPICVGVTPLQYIEPGDSLIVPVVVAGFTSAGREPHINPDSATGTFRIVFGIRFAEPTKESMPFTELPSSTFEVINP